jgi:hypothetical protein
VTYSRLVFRVHAVERMAERGISDTDVRRLLETGEVIAEYPGDLPYRSRLVLGWLGADPSTSSPQTTATRNGSAMSTRLTVCGAAGPRNAQLSTSRQRSARRLSASKCGGASSKHATRVARSDARRARANLHATLPLPSSSGSPR